jgi:DNA gyrase/topoisomerase IV subunit B
VTFAPTTRSSAPSSFDAKELIAERLEAKSYLHHGLEMMFTDETARSRPARRDPPFVHDKGIAEWLPKLVTARGKLSVPSTGGVFYLEKRDDEAKLGVELALQWTESTDELHQEPTSTACRRPTAAPTTPACAPRSSRRSATTSRPTSLDPKGVTLTAEDIREGVVAVLSTYVHDPQFQSQTKNRLNNPEVAAQVEAIVRPALENYLNGNPNWAQAVIARTIIAARAREASRAAHQEVTTARRRSATGSTCRASWRTARRPTRARASCSSSRATRPVARPSRAAIAGPRRSCRCAARCSTPSRPTRQAVVQQGAQDIVSALGCGIGPEIDLSKLRYGKIFLLMDADADGHHIATLLLTFFFRHMRQAASTPATSTWRSRRCTASTSASRRTGRSTISTRSG